MDVPTFRSQLAIFLRAQLLSLCNTSTGILASMMTSRDPPVNIPVFLSLLNYILLAACYFRPTRTGFTEEWNKFKSVLLSSQSKSVLNKFEDIAQLRYPLYVVAAILDVEASVLVLTAFQYTSVTSIVLLDSFAIPCTMILSRIFLGAQYKVAHYIGTLLCMIGLLCNVFSDSEASSNLSILNDRALGGDLLCMGAYLLYASSNVLQEYLVKLGHYRAEFLGMLGCWGALLSIMQLFASGEYTRLAGLPDWSLVLEVVAYVALLFVFYFTASLVLQSDDATYLNLALLTSDIYALIATYLLFGAQVHWLYFISFAFVVVGVVIYHAVETPTQPLLSDNNRAASSASLGEYTVVNAMHEDEQMPIGITEPQSSSNETAV